MSCSVKHIQGIRIRIVCLCYVFMLKINYCRPIYHYQICKLPNIDISNNQYISVCMDGGACHLKDEPAIVLHKQQVQAGLMKPGHAILSKVL